MPENQRINAIIDGFYFDKEQEIERARREVEGIAYIKSNTDMENPETVLRLYEKLIKEDLFETPIGITFLKELRDYLVKIPGIEGQELLPIHFQTKTEITQEKVERKDSVKENPAAKKGRTKRTLEQIQKYLRFSLLLNLFLLILVVGMFIISMSGNNLNIMNYENKIINKYESWEQELEQRETEIKSRQQELGITP